MHVDNNQNKNNNRENGPRVELYSDCPLKKRNTRFWLTIERRKQIELIDKSQKQISENNHDLKYSKIIDPKKRFIKQFDEIVMNGGIKLRVDTHSCEPNQCTINSSK